MYDSGVNVDQGKELTPTQVKNEPIKVEWVIQERSLYTICMSGKYSRSQKNFYTLPTLDRNDLLIVTDPDAPSRAEPSIREVLHWLVVNVPGNDINKGEVNFGEKKSASPILL